MFSSTERRSPSPNSIIPYKTYAKIPVCKLETFAQPVRP